MMKSLGFECFFISKKSLSITYPTKRERVSLQLEITYILMEDIKKHFIQIFAKLIHKNKLVFFLMILW